MDKEIIALIITVLGGIVANWIKNAQTERKFNVKESLLNEKLAEHDVVIQKLEDQLRKSQEGEKFRMEFRDEIAKRVSRKVNNSEILKGNEITHFWANELTEFGKDIAEFGIKFFYSEFRYRKKSTEIDFRRLLKDDLDSILAGLFNSITANYENDKAFKINNKTHSISLAKYIIYNDNLSSEFGILKRSNQLLDRLIKNGLTEVTIFNVFLEYIEDFIEVLKHNIVNYCNLEDYDTYFDKNIDVV